MRTLIQRRITPLLSGCIALGLLALLLCPPALLAATFTHTYPVGTPSVRMLPDGTAVVDIAGAQQDAKVPGAPLVPMLFSRLHIPDDQVVDSVAVVLNGVQALPGTYTLAHAVSPQPISAPAKQAPEAADQAVYSSNEPYPPQAWRRASDQWLHGWRIVITNFFPVRYYPGSGTLECAASVTVTVQTSDGGAAPADRLPPRPLGNDFDAVRNFIDNDESLPALPDSGSSMQPDSSRQYLLITTEALQSSFASLLAHRASAAGGGFVTYTATVENIVATVAGRDRAERIRNFIIDSYANYGTRFVLLGGHAHGVPTNQAVPTRGCTATVGAYEDSYIPSDYYYACLDGNWDSNNNNLFGETNDGANGGDIDWLAEVAVGRIPAETAAEIQTAITKIIAYESSSTNPYRAFLVGEKLDTTPTWGGDRMDYLYEAMNAMPRDTLYDRDAASNDWPKSTLITTLSSNSYNMVFHLGHSNVDYNMKMDNGDLDTVSNSFYFLVYSQGCYSNSFDRRNTTPGSYSATNSMGEDFLVRNAHNAFAYIGNSRYGWYNSGSTVDGSSNWVHRKFVETLFQTNTRRLGQANNESKKALDYTQGVYRWLGFEINLMGDPTTTLNMYTTPSVFWRNTADGRNKLWHMAGTAVTATSDYQVVRPVWRMSGTGDFDGDGQVDIVWRNTSTGENVLWLIRNGTPTAVQAATVADQAWQIQATGDFNRDTKADLFWRNTSTGENRVWYMDGASHTGAAFTPVPDTNWSFAGGGDFNGDSYVDLLLRNAVTGENFVWYLNGITVTGSGSLATVAGTNWSIVGAPDFNGDGLADVYWRNALNGKESVWVMYSNLTHTVQWLPQVPNPNWTISGAASL